MNHLVLLHHPVTNRRGELVTTSVTNLDIHDIARSARTYGFDGYWLVTPLEEQRALVQKIVTHWQRPRQKEFHPDRFEALSRVRVRATFEEVQAEVQALSGGQKPLVVLTEAREFPEMPRLSYGELRARREKAEIADSMILVLGTGWGVSPVFHPQVDYLLPPLYGPGGREGYNHLSVRAAAAAILDRLFGLPA